MTGGRPFMQDHAIRAVRCASAAPIPDKVLGAFIKPPTVWVVAISIVVRVMMSTQGKFWITGDQFVTHWHATSFDDHRILVIILVRLVGEAFGTLGSLLFITLLLWLLLFIIIFRYFPFLVLIFLFLAVSSFLLIRRFLLLITLLNFVMTSGLLFRSRHSELSLL